MVYIQFVGIVLIRNTKKYMIKALSFMTKKLIFSVTNRETCKNAKSVTDGETYKDAKSPDVGLLRKVVSQHGFWSQPPYRNTLQRFLMNK